MGVAVRPLSIGERRERLLVKICGGEERRLIKCVRGGGSCFMPDSRQLETPQKRQQRR